jgi:hypothetical protein
LHDGVIAPFRFVSSSFSGVSESPVELDRDPLGGFQKRRLRLAGCDRDDRDRPRRLLLVRGVPVAVAFVDELPETVVAGVRRLDDSGRGPSTLAPNLNLHVRLRSRVVQPPRRAIRAAIGGDDEVVVAVAGVNQAVGPRCARAATRRAKQERGDANHPVPEPPVGSLVQLLMYAQYLTGETHDTQHMGPDAGFGPPAEVGVQFGVLVVLMMGAPPRRQDWSGEPPQNAGFAHGPTSRTLRRRYGGLAQAWSKLGPVPSSTEGDALTG